MQTEINFDIAVGKHLRDVGIKRAEDKANKDVPGFSEKAFEKIKEFLAENENDFMCEEIRAFAAMDDNFELPENSQAWAGPLLRAKREGLIRFIRYDPVKNKVAHARPGAVWRKV